MSVATEKRYRSFSAYLKETFGCKVHKVSIHAGFTCPNRDGTLGEGGCIYCNNRGFSPNAREAPRSVAEQISSGIEYLKQKYGAEKFIAYFQAYTNTYGPIEKLRELYDEALSNPGVVGISVGTRPDCLSDDTVELLGEISREKQVWVELGLQSAHDSTLAAINRKHTVADFTSAVERLRRHPAILICAHVILGLPGETRDMMLDSARYLAGLGIDGIKIHLFHVLKDTPIEDMYTRGEITLFSMDEYVSLVCDYLELLLPDTVVQRLTADGPGDILIAPQWAAKKKKTMDRIEKELLKRDTWQGRLFAGGGA